MTLPEGKALELDLHVLEQSLRDLPTEYIGECTARALAAKRDDYPLRPAALLREWDALYEELRAEAAAASRKAEEELREGRGSITHLTLNGFRVAHNLPPTWTPTQPYPPSSDLYNEATQYPQIEQEEIGDGDQPE